MALGALLVIWGGVLQAAPPMGMYEAEIELADQGRESRNEAMQEALGKVLLKVSGRTEVLEDEALRAEMANARRYVQQYRYRSESSPTGERSESSTGTKLFLHVSFDRGSVDGLLQRLGFTVWSAARPVTLAWLAVDDEKQRQLVGANDRGLVREVVEVMAESRAIPVKLPLLDLTDQSRVRAVDVWGGFTDNIESASARYESEAILIGKLYPVGSMWEAHWTLLYQGGRHEWDYSHRKVSEVIANGVSGTADYLASYFISTSHQRAEQLLFHVSDVTGMAGFRRVKDYLSSLHGVKLVTLTRADANSADFMLNIVGGWDAVLHAIQMGDVLAEATRPAMAISEIVPQSPSGQRESVIQQDTVQDEDGAAGPSSAMTERYYRLLP